MVRLALWTVGAGVIGRRDPDRREGMGENTHNHTRKAKTNFLVETFGWALAVSCSGGASIQGLGSDEPNNSSKPH